LRLSTGNLWVNQPVAVPAIKKAEEIGKMLNGLQKTISTN
jgi:hypothetical protein